jgi:hypothetical protein
MVQRITIEIHDTPDGGFHWTLFGGDGRIITDSSRYGGKLPFASAEQALRGATIAAHKLLWIERSCL